MRPNIISRNLLRHAVVDITLPAPLTADINTTMRGSRKTAQFSSGEPRQKATFGKRLYTTRRPNDTPVSPNVSTVDQAAPDAATADRSVTPGDWQACDDNQNQRELKFQHHRQWQWPLRPEHPAKNSSSAHLTRHVQTFCLFVLLRQRTKAAGEKEVLICNP